MASVEEIRRLRERLARDYPLRDLNVTVGAWTWKVTAVQDQDALLDRVETDADLERFPYGLLLWASAVGLAEHLNHLPNRLEDRRVLELGAGVGLPGIVARRWGAEVTQSDYQQPALLLARLNAWQNGVEGIRYLLSDWRVFDHAERYDLVIGSDILYERTLHYELAGLLARMLAPGGTILLTDPLRPQAMEFIERMEQGGWRVDMHSLRVEWEEDAREVALYTIWKSGPSKWKSPPR